MKRTRHRKFASSSLLHILPLTPMLKFDTIFFLNLADCKEKNSLYSTTVANVRMKNVGEVPFEMSNPIWSCVNKNFKLL